MNRVAKGNYYRLKTKKWFEKEGYLVENLERIQRIYTLKGVIYAKKDVWGSDLMCKNDKEIIFIQCKTNKGDINKGIKELNNTCWPDFVRKMVVIWPVRAREPEVIEC